MKPFETRKPKGRPAEDGRETENEVEAAVGEIASGIAEAINRKDIVKAFANYIEASAKQKRTAPWLGVAFSAFVFCGIGGLGYLRVINSEATIGLLSAVLGVWFGQTVRRS